MFISKLSNFEKNPNFFVKHHIDSYNDFVEKGIKTIFIENNPLVLMKNKLKSGLYSNEVQLYFGGEDGSEIFYGKPIVNNEDKNEFMYPNHARMQNMTYAFTIHYNILVRYILRTEYNEEIETVERFESEPGNTITNQDPFLFLPNEDIEFEEEYRSPGWDRYKKNKMLKWKK